MPRREPPASSAAIPAATGEDFFSELFDARVRYSGISFVYQFSGIFASGLTPIIATALLRQDDGQPWLVASYMLVVGVISALCAWALRETAHVNLGEPVEELAGSRPGP